MTFRKTTYTFVMLSDDGFPDPENAGLDEAIWAMDEGPCVMGDHSATTEVVDEATMSDLLIAAGSEPEFFSIGVDDA